ncbi:MAG TPA: deoxyguanosinetriphosphate triphosphohydrolase [Aggregatilineales bacterium]|nr:deoxyguanosinetriphosphate triphosphohydrolase [Chloroflexota bacterium]HOA24758.1 deoxyguanosinetriphosphate triphosphohydrolase [Aggregatilineales bacterium]HPV05591.1 deoxyguanosinetriphosphate triphosphohydrolase [Aggregatilineales bacterium]HQA67784.1 deoxyguanosinetriphosphate triphosphohydrolase [Aggregatilineales bacterium]HQE17330.1 deoxyguanosinetriphosphate triphosphohydrolase [Aggregatilineales bacterium]
MLFTREEIEQRERETLAPYAIKSGDSRGRVYPEPEPTHRTAFQRDRDRILHTTAFRRLEYKTQVFVNHEGDYFRTRLTHTLEVAQIGRTLARMLGANEDLVEAICLVHDIGHPPFGHSGEEALAALMEEYGGFDHNQQALRIVTYLENRYKDWRGLNLTYEVREGIVKHETEYDVSNVSPEYEPGKQGSLEAQIANAADELAYTAHDLDDGLYAGLITPRQLDGIALWELGKEQLGFTSAEFDELTRHQLIRRLIGILVRDVAQATHERLEKYNPQSPEELQSLPTTVIGHSEEMSKHVRELKDFLYKNMYRHYRVVRMAKKAEHFITELFYAYLEEPEQLPTSTQQRWREGTDSLGCVVGDYIAGMTDRYALQEYQKLFDPYTLA